MQLRVTGNIRSPNTHLYGYGFDDVLISLLQKIRDGGCLLLQPGHSEPSGAFPLPCERVEVRSAVKCVYALFALESAYDEISDRRGHNFNGDLDHIGRQNHA